MSRPPGRGFPEKRRRGKGPAPSQRLTPCLHFAHPSLPRLTCLPGSLVSPSHLDPGLPALRGGGRSYESVSRSSLRAPRPSGQQLPARRSVRPLGPSPSPPPHFLCGPAGGGPPAPPGGWPGGAGRAPGGSGSERRRWEGPAGCAPGTWPRCLRHCPHLAGGSPRDSQPSGFAPLRPVWNLPPEASAALGPPPTSQPPPHSLGLGFACLRAARATQVPQCDSEFLLTGPAGLPPPPGSPPGSRPALWGI